MLSQSHPCIDSRGGSSGNRGRGQWPHYTYCNRVGHNRDCCYQLQAIPLPPLTRLHSLDSPLEPQSSSSISKTSFTPPSQGVILMPTEFKDYLRLTQQPNVPPLLLFLRQVVSLSASHVPSPLIHGFLSLVFPTIYMIIRTFSLLVFPKYYFTITNDNFNQWNLNHD